MDRTSNELIFDALIVWQILLLRFASGASARFNAILSRADEDVAMILRDWKRSSRGNLMSPVNVRRLNRVIERANRIRGKRWEQAEAALKSELITLVSETPSAMNAILVAVLPVILAFDEPSERDLRRLALSTPFHGRTLNAWLARVRADDAARIDGLVRGAAAEGIAPARMATRVVGTAAASGADGALEITRKQIDALVKTATVHVSSAVLGAIVEENKQFIARELFIAVLDSRTTETCRALHGKKFDIGDGPMPPLHFNCRSHRTFILEADEVIVYKAKPKFSETMSAQRKAMVGGNVPPVPFDTWIRRMPEKLQKEILGTKGFTDLQKGAKVNIFRDTSKVQYTNKDLKAALADFLASITI